MSRRQPKQPDPGLFTVKGDLVGIKDFSFTIDKEGKLVDSSPVVLTSGVDMTAYWLDIGFQHLRNTERWHEKLMAAKDSKDSLTIGKCLKKEARYGMQAIMASGIAIDAYYAGLRNCITIHEDTSQGWRQNKTARYKQVCEVIRQAFPMSNAKFKELRTNLKQIYSWRDSAVHPTSEMSQPAVHVELNKITDPRYVKFRYFNAKLIYVFSLCVIYKTSSNPPSEASKKLIKYCAEVSTKAKPWANKWGRRYGEIIWEYA